MFTGMFVLLLSALDRSNRKKKFRVKINFEADPPQLPTACPRIHPLGTQEQMNTTSHQVQLGSK